MQIYRGYPAFYSVVYAQATRLDGAMKNSVGIFIAEDAMHILPIDTGWPFWMRVSIKFIQEQAVDGIAEIRWIIVLRYVADAIHWICVAPAHNASNAMKFI